MPLRVCTNQAGLKALYRQEGSIIPKNGGHRCLKWVYTLSKLFILIIIQQVTESVFSHPGYSHIQRKNIPLKICEQKRTKMAVRKCFIRVARKFI